ncbi:capsular exopolysaccharide biosynthesis protein [Leptolyngbya sp. Heron Island J]|uniref:hypothetical protein n=1 Tax=Leptolyngbya sp. Heron Island J TaxID=1385935 RepID=UPI0003B96245|nr:hypothetical protein [Leptolyngbya sp. Heron Island J]ESA34070.1 capsular exopolysaccharide biosynthesis protein [Leptolyngbya sp. Heron Island J]
MTSFCNVTKSIQAWPRLAADCLGDQTLYQRQDNNLDSDTIESDNVYWADELDGLSVPTPHTSPWQYHTALAIGATVVCSAGAIMQYTETGLWQPEETGPASGNTVSVNPAKSETDAQVSTPPIASPQAAASVSFSANAQNSGNTCKDSTCKGLEFIEQQVPQIQDQVRQLRAEMQLFQSKHTTQNLQTHRTVLAYRSGDLANRQAELVVRSQELNQKVVSVTSLLALQPDEASYFTNLLQADTQYQNQLQQLQAIEADIRVEFSNPDLDNTHLGELYATYYQIENQLRYTAQMVLADYIYTASLESADPLWQEPTYQTSLQDLMDLSHQQKMVAMEQRTLNQIEAKLTERRTELASLLRQYAVMQRQLDGHNQVLQQYIAKREALQSQLT